MRGLIFDIQHINRAGSPGDRGASAALDGRAATVPENFEAARVLRYVSRATHHAMLEGLPVVLLSEGPYSSRHAQAAQIAASRPDIRWCYFACHLNAGLHATFGLVAHDRRSNGGRTFAQSIARALETSQRGLGRTPDVRVRDVGPNETEQWRSNVFSTISGIWSGPSNLAGVCWEPAFIHDGPFMAPAGLDLIGQAMVRGVVSATF